MMKDAADYLLSEIRETLSRVSHASAEEMVNALVRAKSIFIYGVGRSGLVGKSFSVRLVQMGLDVHFVGDTTTPIVEKEDLVLIISATGETMSAVQTANIVGRIGATVVVVTAHEHSKLSKAATVLVEISPRPSEEQALYAPMGTVFEDSVFVFLDSLVPVIMQRLGQTEQSMRRRHAIWV